MLVRETGLMRHLFVVEWIQCSGLRVDNVEWESDECVCVCVRCVLCELKADSSTGNRTRAFHVTGGDTHHYTIEEHVVVTTITTLKTKPNSTPNSNYQQPIDVNAHTHTHTLSIIHYRQQQLTQHSCIHEQTHRWPHRQKVTSNQTQHTISRLSTCSLFKSYIGWYTDQLYTTPPQHCLTRQPVN